MCVEKILKQTKRLGKMYKWNLLFFLIKALTEMVIGQNWMSHTKSFLQN